MKENPHGTSFEFADLAPHCTEFGPVWRQTFIEGKYGFMGQAIWGLVEMVE